MLDQLVELTRAVLHELDVSPAGNEPADLAAAERVLEREIERLEAALDAVATGAEGQPDWYSAERVSLLRQEVVGRSEALRESEQVLEICCNEIAALDQRVRQLQDELAATHDQVARARAAFSEGRLQKRIALQHELAQQITGLQRQRDDEHRRQTAALRDECDALLADLPGLEHLALMLGDAYGRTEAVLGPTQGDEDDAVAPEQLLLRLQQGAERQLAELVSIDCFGASAVSELVCDFVGEDARAGWYDGEAEGFRRWADLSDRVAAPLRGEHRDLAARQQSVENDETDSAASSQLIEWLEGELKGIHATQMVLRGLTAVASDEVAKQTWALVQLGGAEGMVDAAYGAVPTLRASLTWALSHQWSGRLAILQQGDKIGEILVDTGMIAWASAKAQRRHLGTFLRTIGKVTNEQLSTVRAIFAQTGGTKTFGAILEDQGFIHYGALRRCMILHIRLALETLLEHPTLPTILSPGAVAGQSDMVFYPEEVLPTELIIDVV